MHVTYIVKVEAIETCRKPATTYNKEIVLLLSSESKSIGSTNLGRIRIFLSNKEIIVIKRLSDPKVT